MISICLLQSSNSFSQQVFPSFVHYQIEWILIAISKKKQQQYKIFYSEQWECVNSKLKKSPWCLYLEQFAIQHKTYTISQKHLSDNLKLCYHTIKHTVGNSSTRSNGFVLICAVRLTFLTWVLTVRKKKGRWVRATLSN